jgi:hypothetical protein
LFPTGFVSSRGPVRVYTDGPTPRCRNSQGQLLNLTLFHCQTLTRVRVLKY